MKPAHIIFGVLLYCSAAVIVLFLGGDPLFATPPGPGGADPSSGNYKIDGVHSSILFRIKHLDVTNFYGRFKEMSGSFRVDSEDPSKSRIRIEVPVESVDSNNEGRDRHLKSQDFFSAKEFPTLSFESRKVEKNGDGTYRVTGDLTLRGVAKSVTFTAEHTGTATVSPRFGPRTGFEAVLDFKRSDFGMNYGIKDKVLSDKVRLIIAVEGVPAE